MWKRSIYLSRQLQTVVTNCSPRVRPRMGGSASRPVTDKHEEVGTTEAYVYGLCTMQGWRSTMEDAHAIIPNLLREKRVSLFGVFDGHGGHTLSQHVAVKLPSFLKSTQSCHEGVWDSALTEAFVDLDGHLISDDANNEMMLEKNTKHSNPERDMLLASLAKDGLSIDHLKEEKYKKNNQKDPSKQVQNSPTNVNSPKGNSNALPIDGIAPLEKTANLSGQISDHEALDISDSDSENDSTSCVVDFLVKWAKYAVTTPITQEVTSKVAFLEGCTAVVAVLEYDKESPRLTVANIGDSRCILARAGTAIPLSEDHKPTNKTEYDRVLNAGFSVIHERVNCDLNLSRAFGDHRYKLNAKLNPSQQAISCVPDIQSISIKSTDDFILLGCDGVWEKYNPQDAVNFFYERFSNISNRDISEEDIKRAMSQYLDTCLSDEPVSTQGIGCDNMSVMCIVLKKRMTSTSLYLDSLNNSSL